MKATPPWGPEACTMTGPPPATRLGNLGAGVSWSCVEGVIATGRNAGSRLANSRAKRDAKVQIRRTALYDGAGSPVSKSGPASALLAVTYPPGVSGKRPPQNPKLVPP